MRHISETCVCSPENGERFRDGKNVVEFRSHHEVDNFGPCERCWYDDDLVGCRCIDGVCASCRQGENCPPFFGYYVKINSGLAK